MDFYSRFEQLCNDRGVTPTQAARDNGISQPAVAMWKKRNSTPQANTVQKLADYFGVSVDYLLNGEGKAPIPKDDCSSDIADFYSIFERLCHEKNITPARVRKDLQISQSTMASWKSRGLTPKAGCPEFESPAGHQKNLLSFKAQRVFSILVMPLYGPPNWVKTGLKRPHASQMQVKNRPLYGLVNHAATNRLHVVFGVNAWYTSGLSPPGSNRLNWKVGHTDRQHLL